MTTRLEVMISHTLNRMREDQCARALDNLKHGGEVTARGIGGAGKMLLEVSGRNGAETVLEGMFLDYLLEKEDAHFQIATYCQQHGDEEGAAASFGRFQQVGQFAQRIEGLAA